MSISQTITDFATLAIQAGGWMELDRLYLQNKIAAAIGETALEKTEPVPSPPDVLTLLDQLIKQAVKNQVIDSQAAVAKEQLRVQLLDFLTPPPSVINAFFAQHYAKKPEEATDYFYQLSKNNQAIQSLAKTTQYFFTATTTYGALQFMFKDATLNQGQQELIAAAPSAKAYPSCPLCLENEGYKGRSDYPASTNRRIIRMNLDGESWGFSYAPYELYKEQALIASEAHEEMTLTATTFAQLLRLTEILPHYCFVGAQADLFPLQGELVTHKHYQTGQQEFPLATAEIETYFDLPDYPLMNAGIVKWPMATLRLQGPNPDELVAAAAQILTKWRSYSDETAGVQATTDDGQPSHSITAIARKKDLLFQLDLVLRDVNAVNQYAADHLPLEASTDTQPLEKIGLLNVMGFFPLASAVKKEYEDTVHYLSQEPTHLAEPTHLWAEQLLQSTQTKTTAQELVHTGLGQLYLEKLAAASAFKPTKAGQAALQRFIASL
ncbi:UDP-glucose--hexose-1-phosphate uridylyltransferase [Enterococcus faecalis]